MQASAPATEAAFQAAIVAQNVSVILNKTPILRNISFRLTPGTITGLIGPSGSGKTTLLRAIVGVQRIQKGTLTVLGEPAGSAVLRPKIGYVTQAPSVYTDLTVRQNLQYFAAALGVPDTAVAVALKQVELTPQAEQLVATLSGGQRARVSLAVALLGDAELLVLDEPTVGLDPVLRRELWELFAELATAGRTLLITSHVMDEAERCPQLLLVQQGSILHADTKQALLARTHTRGVEDGFIQLLEARHE